MWPDGHLLYQRHETGRADSCGRAAAGVSGISVPAGGNTVIAYEAEVNPLCTAGPGIQYYQHGGDQRQRDHTDLRE